jgi:hypothetical protein
MFSPALICPTAPLWFASRHIIWDRGSDPAAP